MGLSRHLIRFAGTFSPTKGEGWDEGAGDELLVDVKCNLVKDAKTAGPASEASQVEGEWKIGVALNRARLDRPRRVAMPEKARQPAALGFVGVYGKG